MESSGLMEIVALGIPVIYVTPNSSRIVGRFAVALNFAIFILECCTAALAAASIVT